MTKEKAFTEIREYVEMFAVEPHEGFKANVLEIQLGDFTFALNGRDKGSGYVTVQDCGITMASECLFHQNYDAMAVNRAILAIHRDRFERCLPDYMKRGAKMTRRNTGLSDLARENNYLMSEA